jgi:hypothetical protein
MINEPYIKFTWWLKGFIESSERYYSEDTYRGIIPSELKIIKTELEVLLHPVKEKENPNHIFTHTVDTYQPDEHWKHNDPNNVKIVPLNEVKNDNT